MAEIQRRSDNFWNNVLRALGASPLRNRYRLLGASGRGHDFRAVAVDTAREMTLAVLPGADEHLAALVHHDLSAAATRPILLVRPLGVDLPALLALFGDERSGAGRELWASFASSDGTRISENAARALLEGWREYIGRGARMHPLTPVDRLREALHGVARLRVRPRPGGVPEVRLEEAGEARQGTGEGVWDFPLFLLTNAEINQIRDAVDDAVTHRILKRHGIRLEVEAKQVRSAPGLVLNRHRAANSVD